MLLGESQRLHVDVVQRCNLPRKNRQSAMPCNSAANKRPISGQMGSLTRPAKVVARYMDGRILKGHTKNFDPDRPMFDLAVWDAPAGEELRPIRVKDLKAVFFVKDFEGNREYQESKEFLVPFTGRRLAVRFHDGEVLVGTTFSYDAERVGFFLFPADKFSNNEKVFVLAAAVAEVTKLQPGVTRVQSIVGPSV